MHLGQCCHIMVFSFFFAATSLHVAFKGGAFGVSFATSFLIVLCDARTHFCLVLVSPFLYCMEYVRHFAVGIYSQVLHEHGLVVY